MLDRFPARLAAVLCAAMLAVAGCGEGDTIEQEAGGELAGEPTTRADPPPGSIAEGEPPYTLDTVETALERAGLELQRIAPGTADERSPEITRGLEVDLLQGARYSEARTNQKFDVLVFPTERAARSGMRGLRDTDIVQDGGQIVTAENIVVVADRRFDTDVLNRVQRVLLRLSVPEEQEGQGATQPQTQGGD